MKSPRKLLAVLAVILVIAAAGLVQTFNVWAGRNRDQVRQELQKVLGKDVTFDSLEVNWLGWPGFVAKEFRIADDPRFAATPLVRAKELVLGISLWNLFFQRLVINTLTLNEPEFQIITDETGLLNLTALLRRKNELRRFPDLRPPAPERKHAAVNFLIGAVYLNEGRVEYVDRSIKEPAELRIRHLSMSLKGFEPRAPTKIHIVASLTEGLSQDVKIDGRLDPSPEDLSWMQRRVDLNLRFDSLHVPVVAHAIAALRDKIPSGLDVTGPMALQATAGGTVQRPRIDNITLKIPVFGSSDYNAVANGSIEFSERRSWDDAQIHGKLVLAPLPLDRLRTLRFFDQILPAALAADGSVGLYTVFEGTWDKLRVGALVRADKADVRYKEVLHKRADTPARITTQISRQRQRFLFHDSELVIGANRTGFSGTLDYAGAPRLRLKLNGAQGSVAAWSGLFTSAIAGTAGQADWNITLEKSLSRGDDDWGLNGQLKLTGAEFRQKETGAKIENLNAQVTFAGRQARLQQASFRVGRSAIILDGTAPNVLDPTLVYNLHAPALDLADLPLLTAIPPVQLQNVSSKGEIRLQNEQWVLSGVVTAPQAALREIALRNLRADIVLTAMGLTFKNLSAQVSNGILQSDGYWASTGEHSRQLDFSAKVDALELRALIAQLIPPLNGRLEGQLNGHGQFDAATTDGANVKDALKGSGEAWVQQGVIKDFNLVGQLLLRGSGAGDAGAATSRLPSGFAQLVDRRDTPFDSLKANFTVEQKRVSTENLVITTPEYTITGAGWIGFDRSTQWNGLLVLSPRLTQEFQRNYRIIRYLLDRRGRLAISFRLEGKIPNVKIRFENRALAQALRAGSSSSGDDRDAETKSGQNSKDVKRWLPDALERFLNR